MKKILVVLMGVLLIGLCSQPNMVEGATKAGQKVVVYSASGPEITKPIIELFNSKYPNIQVTVIHAGTPELFAKLQAEKNKPAADVMFGGSPLLFESGSDLFAPYISSQKKYFQMVDPNNIWQPFTIFCQPLLVNKLKVKPNEYPKTVKEVLENGKRWQQKGGIALADPAKSSTGWTIISGIATAYKWDFIEKLLPYCKVTPGSDAMFNAIKDGEAAIGWVNEDLGLKWMQEGVAVEMIYPSDVVTIQTDAYALVKKAPHAKAAKYFLDFLGTKQVHILTTNIIKRRSARKDVNPPGELKKLGALKLFNATEPREVVTAKFNSLQAKVNK